MEQIVKATSSVLFVWHQTNFHQILYGVTRFLRNVKVQTQLQVLSTKQYQLLVINIFKIFNNYVFSAALALYPGASPAVGQGGNAPPIFVFAPPIYFLPPKVFFWEEEVGLYSPEKTLKFVISVTKSLRISAKTFFFFEITCFWPEKNVKISARKSLWKSAKTFAPPILILPPPISRSWRRPCLYPLIVWPKCA